MPIIGSSCTVDTPVWPESHAAGAASLRIYANFVIKPQADRLAVMVCPSWHALEEYPGLLLSPVPLSSEQWQSVLRRYTTIVCCHTETRFMPVGDTGNTLRTSMPRASLRTLGCPSQLHAWAISERVLQSSLPIDRILHHHALPYWQIRRWQPALWPRRWQLEGAQWSLTETQLRQYLCQIQAPAWVHPRAGPIDSLAQFCARPNLVPGQVIYWQPPQGYRGSSIGC